MLAIFMEGGINAKCHVSILSDHTGYLPCRSKVIGTNEGKGKIKKFTPSDYYSGEYESRGKK
jgi:hypothetical protein